MTDEVKVPDGCKLIGWVGSDKRGINLFAGRPVVNTGDFFIHGGNRLNTAVETLPIHIPHMHARPLFIGELAYIPFAPPIEWVTRGECSIAKCEGYSLFVGEGPRDCLADIRCGGRSVESRITGTLPAAQSWAVEKARELAKQSKASGPTN